MTPEEYVKREIVEGRLTYAEIVKLVEVFQSKHGLDVDGKPGIKTQALIEKMLAPKKSVKSVKSAKFLASPMPTLEGGRRAVVTSAYRTKDRPKHNGQDYFYAWREGDKPAFVGDRGAAGRTKSGSPKWVVPYDVCAIAAADGVVQIAGNTATGHRLWIDHGNGWRTGYFHLLDLRVAVGQVVQRGKELGLVGDNPSDNDGRHLHFELSPVDRYAPVDPAPYFE